MKSSWVMLYLMLSFLVNLNVSDVEISEVHTPEMRRFEGVNFCKKPWKITIYIFVSCNMWSLICRYRRVQFITIIICRYNLSPVACEIQLDVFDKPHPLSRHTHRKDTGQYIQWVSHKKMWLVDWQPNPRLQVSFHPEIQIKYWLNGV